MASSTERTPLLQHDTARAGPDTPPASPLSSAFAGLTAANGESAEQQELVSAKQGARTANELEFREKVVILFGCTLACFLSVSPALVPEREGAVAGPPLDGDVRAEKPAN